MCSSWNDGSDANPKLPRIKINLSDFIARQSGLFYANLFCVSLLTKILRFAKVHSCAANTAPQQALGLVPKREDVTATKSGGHWEQYQQYPLFNNLQAMEYA